MSELFKPTTVVLGQQILDSPNDETPPSLDFFLEIAFAEGEFDGEDGTPFLRANHLAAGEKSWRALSDFALVSHDDADLLLFGVRNPVELSDLKIGSTTLSVDVEIDFEMEAYRDELGIVALELRDLPLQIAPLKVHTSLEKRFKGDPDAITEHVGNAIDLTAYAPIAKVPGGFEFPIT